MEARRFVRYQLRTTDSGVARDFYAAVFGDGFWSEDVVVSELPGPALARGARAHWLGHVGVGDVGAAVIDLGDRRAQQLGPIFQGAARVAAFRDPFGAMIGVTSETTPPRREPVAWHLLTVHDRHRAFAFYAELFGWRVVHERDLGEHGAHLAFAWDRSERAIGAVSDLALDRRVHPQWLYFFPVPDVERARTTIAELGGLALPSITTPEGDRVAACDDTQGAAFGLFERRSA